MNIKRGTTKNMTSGMADPRLDCYADLNRACHHWLMVRDEIYRRQYTARKERDNARQIAKTGIHAGR